MQSPITSILGLVSHTSLSNFLLEVPFKFQYTDSMKNNKTVKIKNQKTGKYIDIDKIPVSAFFE